MKLQAAREAVDMCKSSSLLAKKKKINPVKPNHYGNKMSLSKLSCELGMSETEEFDAWLKVYCVGENLMLNIPIKFHRQFHKLNESGELLGSFIVFEDCVQFSFRIETGKKKLVSNCVGIDTGINALATLSTNEQLGTDLKTLISKIKRCKQGSKGHGRAIKTLKDYISITAKQIAQSDIDLIVTEDLKNITKNTKLKGRLSKNMRSSIGKWNVSYWLMRLEQKCEENRVSFRRVKPHYTSQTCSVCGSVDRRNREGKNFLCLKCGHEANADINAAKNILNRFLTGKYGSDYQSQLEFSMEKL